MNTVNPNTVTTPAAPAGEIPAARTAQNITVEQRAAMHSRQRAGQGAAPAPSTPATPSAAATTPAPNAAPSEGTPAGSAGTEPNPLPPAGAATAAPPAPLEAPAPNIAEAIAEGTPAAGATTETTSADESGDTPDATAGTAAAAALNGHAPEWLDAILKGDNKQVPLAIKQLAKRVAQLTFEARSAQAALAAAGGEVAPTTPPAEPGAAPDVGTEPGAGDPPAATVPTQQPGELDQLQAGIARELDIVRWCEQNRQGGTIQTKNGPVEFDASQVADQLVASQDKLQDLKTRRGQIESEQRQALKAEYKQAESAALKAYPWINDPKSAEYKEAKAYLDRNPTIRQDPQWPLVIGRYVAGLMVERKAKPTPPPVAPPLTRPKSSGAPAPVPGAPPAPAPRVDPVQKQLSEAREAFRKSGLVKDKQKVFALERRLQAA